MKRSKRKVNRKLFSILLAFFFFYGVVNLSAQRYFNDLEDTVQFACWINVMIEDSVQGHSGSHYTVAVPSNPFGLGFESRFPETVRGNNTRIYCHGWVKSNRADDQALFVITVQQGSETVLWKSIDLSKLLTEKEKWVDFAETITIPVSITANGGHRWLPYRGCHYSKGKP